MRYGIVSDIHGNLEAFETVLETMETEQIDTYWCLGDIVGYGANPNECLERVWALTSDVVAGNHDFAAVGKIDLVNFNRNAAEAALWTMQCLTRPGRHYLSDLPFLLKQEDVVAVHSTLSEPNRWAYLLSLSQAAHEFQVLPDGITLCFVGHTHTPVIFVESDGKHSAIYDSQCQLKPEHRYIVNVGSVGQPRDGDSRAAYCVYDTETGLLEIKRVPYDINTAQKKILKAGLPDFLATRLAHGR